MHQNINSSLAAFTISYKMKKTQFIYPEDANGGIAEYFRSEVEAMRRIGLSVETKPNNDSSRLIHRCFRMYQQEEYPTDARYIQGWNEYMKTSRLSLYYKHIEDISIPTFFTRKLDESVAEEVKKRGWKRAFIKNDIKSLWNINEMASVWPDSSFDYITNNLTNTFHFDDIYAVRKFIDQKVFFDEDRYWVFEGVVRHRNPQSIPPVVYEAVRRLECLGSHYYVVDATPDFIVEINPGESSDRYGDNPPELFAQWMADAFGD